MYSSTLRFLGCFRLAWPASQDFSYRAYSPGERYDACGSGFGREAASTIRRPNTL